MRQLKNIELNAVSGGHGTCTREAAPKPAPTTCGSTKPLSYLLGFLGGALKLICTGVPSTSTCTGGTTTPTTPADPILR